jgi:inorganic triphosphatase YgiF
MVRHPDPDPTVFGDDIRDQLARLTKGDPLTPVFVTDVRRTTRDVQLGSSTIEIAIDNGFVRAGDKRQNLREIEIELKSGDAGDLYKIGLALLDSLPVRLDTVSKSERGVRLITGLPRSAQRPTPAAISASMSLDEAIAVIIRNCLSQFTANWPAFLDGDPGEAVHQMRVSMRRLRAALAFFGRVLPQAGFDVFRAQARDIASIMGHARDWDVFAALVRSGPAAHFPGDLGLAAVLEGAARQSVVGRQDVAALLQNPATSRFVLTLDAFVARHGWRNGADLQVLTQPVSLFASQCLELLDKRVRKAGKSFASLPTEQRHELRIRLKNLRYAADFFGQLFKGQSKVRRFARKAADMQEHLGHLNDAAVARSLLERSVGGDAGTVAFASGVIAGWYAGAASSHEAVLQQAWSDFLAAERYWRDGPRAKPSAGVAF